RSIWRRHSRTLRERCSDVWGWIDDAITFHDAGKGSEPFQAYIPDPSRYRGARKLKAHTPLSLLCALAHAREHGWHWTKCLSVASSAAGHHSEFKTEEELRNVCGSDEMMSVLERQLSTLDWDALDAALGLRLTRIPPTDGLDLASEADDQIEGLVEQLRETPDRLSYRLRCQLAFSVLLEADKAFLAVQPADVARYLEPNPTELPPSLVEVLLASKPSAIVNPLRAEARSAFLGGLVSAS